MRKTFGDRVATDAGWPVERYAWAGCAVAVAGFAQVSDLVTHRVWGWAAAAGYTLAAFLEIGRAHV